MKTIPQTSAFFSLSPVAQNRATPIGGCGPVSGDTRFFGTGPIRVRLTDSDDIAQSPAPMQYSGEARMFDVYPASGRVVPVKKTPKSTNAKKTLRNTGDNPFGDISDSVKYGAFGQEPIATPNDSRTVSFVTRSGESITITRSGYDWNTLIDGIRSIVADTNIADSLAIRVFAYYKRIGYRKGNRFDLESAADWLGFFLTQLSLNANGYRTYVDIGGKRSKANAKIGNTLVYTRDGTEMFPEHGDIIDTIGGKLEFGENADISHVYPYVRRTFGSWGKAITNGQPINPYVREVIGRSGKPLVRIPKGVYFPRGTTVGTNVPSIDRRLDREYDRTIGVYLTDTERSIVRMLADGKSLHQIGLAIGVSKSSVQHILNNIRQIVETEAAA